MERSTLPKWLVGLVIAVILGFFAGRQQQLLNNDREILQQLRELRTSPQPKAQGAQPAFDLKIEDSAMKGDAEAKLVLVEFSDFECPYCGRYVKETYPQVDRDYVRTGKIRYVFRHFPLANIHPQAIKAGEAAECARRQGKFWPFHDSLFVNQKLLSRESLVDHGRAVGLEMKTFETCLDGDAAATVLADLETGTKAGVNGTPTFLLGFAQKDGSVRIVERVVGAAPYANFQSALDKLLATAPRAE